MAKKEADAALHEGGQHLTFLAYWLTSSLTTTFGSDCSVVQQHPCYHRKYDQKHDAGIRRQAKNPSDYRCDSKVQGIELLSCSHNSPFVDEKNV